MDYVYLLVSLSVMLLIGAVCGILWAVKSDQFEDLEGPGHAILMDDDTPKSNSVSDKTDTLPPINTKN